MPKKKTVNLSPSSFDPAFGQNADASVKAKIVNLIASVRTLMRSKSHRRPRVTLENRQEMGGVSDMN